MLQQSHTHAHSQRAAHASKVQGQIDLLKEAIQMLAREGHTILAAGVGQTKPFIFLAPSGLLTKLADSGRAAYWMRGIDEDGQHYRKGQLLGYTEILVTWTERGH